MISESYITIDKQKGSSAGNPLFKFDGLLYQIDLQDLLCQCLINKVICRKHNLKIYTLYLHEFCQKILHILFYSTDIL